MPTSATKSDHLNAETEKKKNAEPNAYNKQNIFVPNEAMYSAICHSEQIKTMADSEPTKNVF